MTERENYMRTIKFGNPEWIPVKIIVNFSSLIQYGEEMEEIITRYPEFFGPFQKGMIDYTAFGNGDCNLKEMDSWGCEWYYAKHGIEGIVTKHPLDDWAKLEAYRAPNPNEVYDRGGRRDWQRDIGRIAALKANGQFSSASLIHGFLFLRLQYLRGFENLMYDMADDEPRLLQLIEMVDNFNLEQVKKYCLAGIDMMELPEDLGAEKSMIISRDMFQRYIKPSYKKLVDCCKQNGALVYIHSDGYILDILEDLIELGMDIINPQDLCNGIDNLEKALKGKTCIRLDIDRTKITPFGTRNEIFELIEYETKTLGSAKGGLEFIYGVYPPMTPQNLNYLCEALKKYQRYFWQ